ncbi:MAG: VanZ family protein [Chloroflexi bacterium]|nr:VanZ family protein [Chloroflexota bacterium]
MQPEAESRRPVRTSFRTVLRLWGRVILWMGVIFWFSAQPNLPRASQTWLDFIIKKGAHAFVYAVLAALVWRALREQVAHRIGAYSFALALLYAISDEFHQTFVAGRHGRPFDVLVDASGILIGIFLISRRRRRIRSQLDGNFSE